MKRNFFGSSPRAESAVSISSDAEGSNSSRRRATFAFMKYSPKTSSTPTTMRRTREHAKRIAQQLSSNAPLSPTFDDNDDLDDHFFAQLSASESPANLKAAQQKSRAFDLDPLVASKPSNHRLAFFVERHAMGQSTENKRPPKFSSPSASSVISQDTSVSAGSKNSKSRSIKSMPTLPSNSTMQASNIQLTKGGQMITNSPKPLDDQFSSSNPLNSSNRSFGSVGSGGKSNRLQSYSQTPRLPITPGSVSPSRAGDGGGSTNSTATISPVNSVNFFTEGIESGFSFDAFGLDESMVDREVTAAIKELAGEWGVGGGVDEFPLQSFDSPTASRSPSPEAFDDDGFEDGFRLTGISGLPLQARQSPAGSERSSLSSRSNPWEDKGPSRQMQLKQQPSKQNQQYPIDDDGWATFGDSPFTEAFEDPFKPEYAQSEPGLVSKPKLPPLPVLDKSLPLVPSVTATNDDFFSLNSLKKASAIVGGTPSNVSTVTGSDILIDSDVGVSSDVGVNCNVGEIPVEVKGSKVTKSNTKKTVAEEKKECEMDVDDESYAEWSIRSPVKQIETWGDDITPLEPDYVPPTPLPRQQPHQAQLKKTGSTPLIGSASSSLKSVEAKFLSEQELRTMECTDQRSSLESLKERLKAVKGEPTKRYAKSEVGALRSPSELSAVLNRVRRRPTFDSDAGSGSCGSSVADLASKFEKPSSKPSFFVDTTIGRSQQLRKETRSEEMKRSPHERRDIEIADLVGGSIANETSQSPQHQSPQSFVEQQLVERHDVCAPQGVISQSKHVEEKPRKLTYREQRELELRKVREEKERQAVNEILKAPPDRDVAALIRKRISCKKQSAVIEAESKTVVENFGNVRNRLKRVSIESKITQFHAVSHGETQSQASPTKERLPSVSVESEPLHSPKTDQVSAPNQNNESNSPCSQDISSLTDDLKTEAIVKSDAPHPLAAIHESIANSVISEAADKTNPSPIEDKADSIADSTADTKAQLNAFFAKRLLGGRARDSTPENHKDSLMMSDMQGTSSPAASSEATNQPLVKSEGECQPLDDGRPALKNDPKYDRYFRMLKVGMPMPVVKHAMTRDGVDPSVMDGDHNKPAGYGAGVPLKQDPKYARYFKMLNMGLPMGAVKNAMERDGLDPSVMDRDHNLPANVSSTEATDRGDGPKEEKRVKDTHRRTRLHWDTARKVRSNSLWAKINQDEELESIQIDEDEFQELFQAELTPIDTSKGRVVQAKKGAAVRVIDSKRANNGGIILARLKMTHDELADAVDRIDHQGMSPEQMQNIIEYLPTSDERKALEVYMLSGGIDAAEKFDGLCECEKFMVAMMTVKHAKRKVRALLFKLQFQSCLDSLEADTAVVESACDELINSVRLRKLLGIVLNIGNRLNTAGVSGKGKAGAFSLESLLKLNHAKAFDKKTTFLHYIVLIVQRNNELLLRVKDDLPTVVRASRVYWDQLEQDLEEVENQLENVRKISLHQARLMTSHRLRKKKKAHDTDDDENSLSDSSMTLEEEVESLRASDIGLFTLGAIKKVSSLRDKVELTKGKFMKLREYFGEEDKTETQPHEIFNIIATFCRDFEKAKDEVSNDLKRKMREERKLKRTSSDPNISVKASSGNNDSNTNGKTQVRSHPILHVSNHQPNLHPMTSAEKPLQNGQHTSTNLQRSQSMPINGQSNLHNLSKTSENVHSSVHDSRPVSKSQRNGSHTPVARPPMRPVAPKAPNSVIPSSPASQMPASAMRQKALQRRRRVQMPHPSGDASISSSISSYPSTDRSTDATFAALGRRVGDDSINQLSPRSTIRQRRREDQRRVASQGQAVTQWPDEHDDFLQEVDFALD